MTLTLRNLAITFVLVAIAAFVLASEIRPGTALGNAVTATNIGNATTTTSVAITSSARILATTTNPTGTPGVTSFTRVYATICNPNANPVAILLNRDIAASAPSGRVTTWIAAAAGYEACYEITDRNAYHGSITASSTNQTSTTVYVSDYVQ